MSLYAAFAPVEIAYRQQYLHQLAQRSTHPTRRRYRPRLRSQGRVMPDRIAALESATFQH